MLKNFRLVQKPEVAGLTSRTSLQVGAALLAVLNAFALFAYLAPPGGSRADLEQQSAALRTQIRSMQVSSLRLKSVAAKVQQGSDQDGGFESTYFLPRRLAFERVLSELLRMEAAAGIQGKDRVYQQEPIEGTDDLTLLNVAANYEGSYANLLSFLKQIDRSPMLLMLDSLQASPQQSTGRLNAVLRLQAVIREEPAVVSPQAGQSGQGQ